MFSWTKIWAIWLIHMYTHQEVKKAQEALQNTSTIEKTIRRAIWSTVAVIFVIICNICECEAPVHTRGLMTSAYVYIFMHTPDEQLFECFSLLLCVCLCICVCAILSGANGFQLPSNTVEGAYSTYESVCVFVCVCVWESVLYEIIIIISQLHWVSLWAVH